MSMRIFQAIALLFLLSPFPASAQQARNTPQASVELVSSRTVLAPGETSWWGVSFRLAPHWHVYWKNPGDSGASPKFAFEVSGGEVSGDVQWPVPRRIPLGDLVNFGYEDRVIYPFEVKAHSGESLTVRAKLEWLVCQEECVPGFATLELKRPVQERSVTEDSVARLITEELSRVPSTTPMSGKLHGKALSPSSYELTYVPGSRNQDGAAWEIFPVDGERFSPQKPTYRSEDGGGRLIWTFATNPAVPPSTASFVVNQSMEDGRSGAVHEFSVPVAAPEEESLGTLLLFAFLGGVILNLMPCVFPVLSIKVFSMVKESGGGRGALLREGLMYTFGVLVTFLALGGVFLLLRQGGEAVGWGFQLQSPLVVFLLIMLFFVLALNFLGVFEWGTFLMNWAGGRSSVSSGMGSFGTGVLSVFIAAPCTGPFMGAALGAAVSLPPWPAMGLFLALGAGLAAPILLLCAQPGGLKILPRPGAWMETLKEFFAFPLFATVLWLLWVLVQQSGNAGVLIAGAGILTMAFSFWLPGKGRLTRIARGILIVTSIAGPVWLLRTASPDGAGAGTAASASAWEDYDDAKILAARSAGRAVFVDFTAAWCITCQWNKKVVLETDAALRLFREQDVLLLRGDWTRYDEKITKALSVFGRASVPLYVFYPQGGGEPRILPQMLALSMIEELFSTNQGGSR